MIVVLEVVSGAQTGKRITIRKDQIFTFGRTNLADEMFPDDVMMSGKHFQIENTGQFSFLSDLGSRNGTKVNDGYVKKLDLKNGHVIQAGRTRFTVHIEGGARNPYESIQGGSGLSHVPPPSDSPVLNSQDPRFAWDEGSQADRPDAPRPNSQTPADLPSLPDKPPGIPGSPPPPPGGSAGMPPGSPGAINPSLIDDPVSFPATDVPELGGGDPPVFQPPPPSSGTPGYPPPPTGRAGGDDGPQFKFFKGSAPPGPVVPGSGPPGPVPPGNVPSPGPGSPNAPYPPSGPPGAPPPPLPKVPLSEFGEPSGSGPPASEPPAFENPPATPLPGPPGPSPNIEPLPEPPLTADPPGMSQPGFSGPGVGNFSPGGPSPGPGGLRGGRPPINPSLVDWEDPSEPGPVGSNPAGPAAWSPPQPESGGQGGNFPEAAAAAPILGGGDWRNPPVSGAGPAPTADQPSPSQPAPPDAAEPEAPESATAPRAQVKLAKRFGRETTASNLTVCRTFDLEGSGGDLLPSRLLQALAKQSKLVLAIHFMRAGIDIPEDLPGGVPIRTDLPPEVAGLAGPMLLKPDDFPGFAEVVDQAWDQDAVIAFLTKDPEAAIRHLQQMIHFDEKLEPASKEKKALFCAVYSPNLFTSFLCTRDEAAVKRLLGESIEGVVTEIADLPGNWQLLAQSDWTERLEKLGLKQQETSDVAGP